ncbi:MAG: hypothetical protein H6825_00135 [Planctomycetes bacterium]|nr:hypothetical protein [Planctomycetota bacterium]
MTTTPGTVCALLLIVLLTGCEDGARNEAGADVSAELAATHVLMLDTRDVRWTFDSSREVDDWIASRNGADPLLSPMRLVGAKRVPYAWVSAVSGQLIAEGHFDFELSMIDRE